MKKVVLLHLIIFLVGCNQSCKKSVQIGTSKETILESNNIKEPVKELEKEMESSKRDPLVGNSKEIKSLFSLSPLSIFDITIEGIEPSEKRDLLKKGESDSWKIIEENKAKLVIHSKNYGSQVTLRFFRNKDNLDGVLFTEIENRRSNILHSWKYIDERETLQKTNLFNNYSVNDFVSKEDKLPDTYQPLLYYLFIDDQTIEVSPHTWMEKEFENREIINRIFLKWNGESFVEKIERINGYSD